MLRPLIVSEADLAAGALPPGSAVLGALGFGGAAIPLAAAVPAAPVAMAVLGQAPAIELWLADEPATYGAADGCRFAIAGDTIFAIVDPGLPECAGMQAMAQDLYARLFALADRTGHPHVIRAFNYLSAITGEEAGTERYRRFNTGRHAAFLAAGRAVAAAPAACALGMRAGPPVVAFIAARRPGLPLENPRQVSAYHYPAQFGRHRPSFSRALRTADALHISGTASIVGHRSLHAGDVAAQAQEALRNVAALLSECGGLTLEGVAARLVLKAYVRHAADLPAVQAVLAQAGLRPALILHAEICRPELLVEVEGFLPL